MFDSLIRQ